MELDGGAAAVLDACVPLLLCCCCSSLGVVYCRRIISYLLRLFFWMVGGMEEGPWPYYDVTAS